MGKNIICGIDAHQNKLVTWTGVDKVSIGRKDFNNDVTGRKSLFQYLEILRKKYSATKIDICYEASAIGYRIYDESKAAGIECYVLAPTKIQKSNDEQKRKNDERDAEKLFELLKGHLLAGNKLPSIEVPSFELRDDRELIRERLEVGNKISRLKGQIQMLLKRNGIEKEEVMENWTNGFCYWLKHLDITEGSRKVLDSKIRQLEALESENDQLTKHMVKLAQNPRYKAASKAIVDKVMGAGLLTAMVFLTELGRLNRFKNRKQIGAYIGLTPKFHESGEQTDCKGHITHSGSKRLRKVLCQASWACIAHDQRERERYEGIVQRNPKHKKIAVVACMRRMAIRIWHIAMDATYSPMKQAA